MVKGKMPPPPPMANKPPPAEHAVPPPKVEAPGPDEGAAEVKQFACIACEDTRVNSKGGPCAACSRASEPAAPDKTEDAPIDKGPENEAPPEKEEEVASGDDDQSSDDDDSPGRKNEAWNNLVKSNPEDGRKRRTPEQIQQDGIDSALMFLETHGYTVSAPAEAEVTEVEDPVKSAARRLRRISVDMEEIINLLQAAKPGITVEKVDSLLQELQEKLTSGV